MCGWVAGREVGKLCEGVFQVGRVVEKAGGRPVDRIVDGIVLTTVGWVVCKVVSVVVCPILEVSFVSVLFSVAVGWVDISVVGGQYGRGFVGKVRDPI